MVEVNNELNGKYKVDKVHSQLGFSARHAMVTKVRGFFNEFSGEGYLDFDNLAKSSFTVKINVSSIDTRNADRDEHLKSSDFFSLADNPEIVFTSKSILKSAANTYKISGDLSMRGVTKNIDFDLSYTGSEKDPFGNQRIGFEGRTFINRKDWGLVWNAALDSGGVLVSDKVELEFEISAIKE